MLIGLLLLLDTGGTPNPTTVDTISALQVRLDSAKPGDVIHVKHGTYTTAGPIIVKTQGSAGKPIRIAAETVAGVTINGSDGFDVIAPAPPPQLAGFCFTPPP